MLGSAVKLFRLDPQRRAYLVAATMRLGMARIEYARQSTKSIIQGLQAPAAGAASPARATAFRAFDPNIAAWAIETAARRVPWRADCLLQAMAASSWLRRYGYQPGFQLGLARLDNGELAAHAWLTLDRRVLVGGSAAAVSAYVPLFATDGAEDAAGRPG